MFETIMIAIAILVITTIFLITLHLILITIPNRKEEKAWFDMMTDISRARRNHYTAVRHDYRYK